MKSSHVCAYVLDVKSCTYMVMTRKMMKNMKNISQAIFSDESGDITGIFSAKRLKYVIIYVLAGGFS